VIDYSEIDPGVRRLVRWLNELGFETTDSGDGVSKPDMECALAVPNVAIVMGDKGDLIHNADCLHAELVKLGVFLNKSRSIQASYDPDDGSCIILLLGVSDADLPAGVGEDAGTEGGER
jgi:hypothetical protein